MGFHKRKKVLYVIGGLCQGGAESQTVNMIERLDRSLFDPSLLIFTNEKKIFFRQILDSDVEVTALGATDYPDLVAAAKSIAGISREIRSRKPDLVHALLNLGNTFARLVSVVHPQGPVISSIRSEFLVFYPPLHQKIERSLSRRSRFITVNLMETKRQLEDFLPIESDRIVYIPNGVDTERFHPEGPVMELAGARRGGEGSIVFTIAGSLSRRKNQMRALEALDIANNLSNEARRIRLVLIGATADNAFREELETYVGNHDISSQVIFMDPVEKIEKVYRGSDFLLLPALFEGLPNVVLEAMACEVPVLISGKANKAGVVDHGVNGWVFDDSDPEQLAHLMLKTAAMNENKKQSTGRAGREKATAVYSWASVMRQYENLYMEACGETG